MTACTDVIRVCRWCGNDVVLCTDGWQDLGGNTQCTHSPTTTHRGDT